MSGKLIGGEAAHNKGQEDGSNDEYDPPHSSQDIFLSGLNPFQDTDAMIEENEKYNDGREHGESQSSRVICTHFYLKGMLPQKVWRADMKFTAEYLSETTVRGYHFWAISYVKLMRKSPIAECSMYPVAKWRAEELAYKMGELPHGNFKGKLIRLVLEPICWSIGCVVSQKDWKVLYSTGS